MPRYTRTHRYPRGRLGSFRRQPQASGAWTPASLSGLVLWLDAGLSPLFQNSNGTTAATADGDPVGYWGDLSSAANPPVQATSGKRGTLKTGLQNGRNIVRFDGVDDLLETVAAVTLKPVTFFAVLAATLGANGGVLGSANTAPGAQTLYVKSTGHPMFVKSSVAIVATGTTALSTGVAAVVTATYDASGNYVFRVNGAAAGSGTNDTAIVAAAVQVANDRGAAALPCDVATCGLYTTAYGTTQLQQLEAYLNTRWAVY